MSKEEQKLSAEDHAKLCSMRPSIWVDVQADTPTTSKRARTDLIGVDYQRSILIVRMPDEIKYGNLLCGQPQGCWPYLSADVC